MIMSATGHVAFKQSLIREVNIDFISDSCYLMFEMMSQTPILSGYNITKCNKQEGSVGEHEY